MLLIEPCCAPRHIAELRQRITEEGTVFWHGHGDLSLNEILPALTNRYANVEMTIVAPALPDAAIKAIENVMAKQWARADGKGMTDVISHLTIITNLQKKKSPKASAWLKENPYGERLMLKNVQQNDTAIILPDIALIGPINLTYGGHFTAVATRKAKTLEALKIQLQKM